MDREKEIEEKALVVSPALAELRPASLTHFAGLIDRCGRSERVEGTAIRLDVSCALLAASRRDGGVRHRFGVLEFDACCIGAMLTHADRELHAVLFDLGASEMKNFFMEAEALNAFRVLIVAETGDLRLMLPPRSEGMDMLFEATRKARSVPALELAGAAAEAARFVV